MHNKLQLLHIYDGVAITHATVCTQMMLSCQCCISQSKPTLLPPGSRAMASSKKRGKLQCSAFCNIPLLGHAGRLVHLKVAISIGSQVVAFRVCKLDKTRSITLWYNICICLQHVEQDSKALGDLHHTRCNVVLFC